METLTVRPSLPKVLLFIGAFAAVGLAGSGIIEYFGDKDTQNQAFIWFFLFVVSAFPILILSLTPILFYFRLEPGGLQIRFLFRRTPFFKWRFFERIGRWDQSRAMGAKRQHVAFAFRLKPANPDKPAPKPGPIMERTRQETGGLYDLMLPVAFGIDTDKLVAVLNDWRIRYGTPPERQITPN